MHLTKILLGLMATTIVSSLTTPNSRSIHSLDSRKITAITDFPALAHRSAGTAEKAAWVGRSIKERRQIFTKSFVEAFNSELDPTLDAQCNAIIICNVDYVLTGTPIWKGLVVYNPSSGAAFTFDVVVFGTGTFTRKGDGGWENWAAKTADKKCTKPAEDQITCTA